MARPTIWIALAALVALAVGCDADPDGESGTDTAVARDTDDGGDDTGATPDDTSDTTTSDDTTVETDTTSTDTTTAQDTATATDTSTDDTGATDTSTADMTDTSTGDPCTIFPADNPWNTDISAYPVHADSDAFIDSIGRGDTLHPDFGTVWQGAPIGIPYVVVPGDQARVPVTFQYADESDPGPYPIPPDAPIEGGPDAEGDRHVLALDLDGCMLYELFYAFPENGGQSWTAGSGAIFDLRSNDLRPDGWTSADAAGLPIFPGLVRYDEVVEDGVINHALRFTVSQSQRGYIHPATHFASSSTDPAHPPMGLRLRMKASYDCSGFSSEVQVICAAMKTYGMFVADNGSDWYVSGAPDSRWDDDALGDLKSIPGDAFEVVDTGSIITD